MNSCDQGDKYFDSYDDLEVHRLMLSDSPRTEAYRDAILTNPAFFKDKIVMGKYCKSLAGFF